MLRRILAGAIFLCIALATGTEDERVTVNPAGEASMQDSGAGDAQKGDFYFSFMGGLVDKKTGQPMDIDGAPTEDIPPTLSHAENDLHILEFTDGLVECSRQELIYYFKFFERTFSDRESYLGNDEFFEVFLPGVGLLEGKPRISHLQNLYHFFKRKILPLCMEDASMMYLLADSFDFIEMNLLGAKLVEIARMEEMAKKSTCRGKLRTEDLLREKDSEKPIYSRDEEKCLKFLNRLALDSKYRAKMEEGETKEEENWLRGVPPNDDLAGKILYGYVKSRVEKVYHIPNVSTSEPFDLREVGACFTTKFNFDLGSVLKEMPIENSRLKSPRRDGSSPYIKVVNGEEPQATKPTSEGTTTICLSEDLEELPSWLCNRSWKNRFHFETLIVTSHRVMELIQYEKNWTVKNLLFIPGRSKAEEQAEREASSAKASGTGTEEEKQAVSPRREWKKPPISSIYVTDFAFIANADGGIPGIFNIGDVSYLRLLNCKGMDFIEGFLRTFGTIEIIGCHNMKFSLPEDVKLVHVFGKELSKEGKGLLGVMKDVLGNDRADALCRQLVDAYERLEEAEMAQKEEERERTGQPDPLVKEMEKQEAELKELLNSLEASKLGKVLKVFEEGLGKRISLALRNAKKRIILAKECSNISLSLLDRDLDYLGFHSFTIAKPEGSEDKLLADFISSSFDLSRIETIELGYDNKELVDLVSAGLLGSKEQPRRLKKLGVLVAGGKAIPQELLRIKADCLRIYYKDNLDLSWGDNSFTELEILGEGDEATLGSAWVSMANPQEFTPIKRLYINTGSFKCDYKDRKKMIKSHLERFDGVCLHRVDLSSIDLVNKGVVLSFEKPVNAALSTIRLPDVLFDDADERSDIIEHFSHGLNFRKGPTSHPAIMNAQYKVGRRHRAGGH
jgi:hypothetical protein